MKTYDDRTGSLPGCAEAEIADLRRKNAEDLHDCLKLATGILRCAMDGEKLVYEGASAFDVHGWATKLLAACSPEA